MKIIPQAVSVVLISVALAVAPGCQAPGANGSTNNTSNGAMLGGALGAIAGAVIGNQTHNAAAGAAIGALFGAATGAIIGHHMDDAQRQWLKEHAPQTLQTIDHNDAIAQAAAKGTAPEALEPKEPLTVANIKDIASAGVKNDVVIDEIQKSGSKYSSQEIADLQQAGVNTAVIEYIKTHAAA